jgi:methionine synthase II (cobalamin-independent)
MRPSKTCSSEERYGTSKTRLLTTHVGSLPRSARLTELLLRQERGEVVDEAELDV